MQAAFVDVGLEKAAFLYVGDYLDDQGQLDPDTDEEDSPRPRRNRGRNGGQRPPPKIETLLREGQEIVVQIAKEPIGTKGARITSHVSIAGRHLVLTPWSKRVGVSRRIDSDRERRRLRDIVTRLRPREIGFIIRTAGEGTREADLEADVNYLASVWEDIQILKDQRSAPAELFSELALPLRAIRDFANARTKRIVIDDPTTHKAMEDFLSRFVADPKPRLEFYEGELPIFDQFKIESSIDDNLGKKVWLKSGGYLIIDQSEALTAIDVNTGRYVGKRDLEETVLKTNLEAVQEVVYQLRFRNIGGLIIIDLIDMETADNREKVYRALQDALRSDKSRTNILKISELGLVEMTRKRTRENLVQQLCEPCSYCEGRGYVASAETVAFKVLREIRKDLPRFCGQQIALTVSPRVAEMLLGRARKATQALGEALGREIEIRARAGLHQEQFEVVALDEGPPVGLSLRWLSDGEESEEAAPEAAAAEVADEPSGEAAAATEPAADEAGESDRAAAATEALEPAGEGAEAPEPEADAADEPDRAAAATEALEPAGEGAEAPEPEADAADEPDRAAAAAEALEPAGEGAEAPEPRAEEREEIDPPEDEKIEPRAGDVAVLEPATAVAGGDEESADEGPAPSPPEPREGAASATQAVDAKGESPILPRFQNPEES
jgi:ribonuclease G